MKPRRSATALELADNHPRDYHKGRMRRMSLTARLRKGGSSGPCEGSRETAAGFPSGIAPQPETAGNGRVGSIPKFATLTSTKP